MNADGKGDQEHCHTFLDDVVGALGAAASTRVAQILSEEESRKDPHVTTIQLELEE